MALDPPLLHGAVAIMNYRLKIVFVALVLLKARLAKIKIRHFCRVVASADDWTLTSSVTGVTRMNKEVFFELICVDLEGRGIALTSRGQKNTS